MNEEKKLNAETLEKVAGGSGREMTCNDCVNIGSTETCPYWSNPKAVAEIKNGTHPLCHFFETEN